MRIKPSTWMKFNIDLAIAAAVWLALLLLTGTEVF